MHMVLQSCMLEFITAFHQLVQETRVFADHLGAHFPLNIVVEH